MYKILNYSDIPDENKVITIIDSCQLGDMITVFDDYKNDLYIGTYKYNSTMLRTGLIYEIVKYLQCIDPNYRLYKLPSYSKYHLLETIIGSTHMYHSFYNDMSTIKAPIEDTFDIITFYMNLVNSFEHGKNYILNLEVMKYITNIIRKFNAPIYSANNNMIQLPIYNSCYNTYLKHINPPYVLGQIIVDKEFKTIKEYWSILMTLLCNTLRAIDENVDLSEENIIDTIDNINKTYSCLPDIQINKVEITKNYISAFNYKENEFVEMYSTIINILNNIYSNINDSSKIDIDSTILNIVLPKTTSEDVDIKDGLKVLLQHFHEAHEVLSEMYRVVFNIVNKQKIMMENNMECYNLNIDSGNIYSILFNTISELCIYVVVVRMTISLLYARFNIKNIR